MNLDRTADEENMNLPNSTTHCAWISNIWSLLFSKVVTLVHGYDGIILEATDASQVLSVTLF